MNDDTPSMRSYGRHLLICEHGDCADPEAAVRLQQRFRELAQPLGLMRISLLPSIRASCSDRHLHYAKSSSSSGPAAVSAL